ncbi:MAG: toll/interleukin-1 receptor domain-containing protein [Acidobacteriota bacterium]
MSFQYSCFISYPALDANPIMETFINELHGALKGHLAFLMPHNVFLAPVNTKYGTRFTLQLGEAICRSVCWIVVYSPIYDQHPYCLQEYAAMEQVEGMRREVLRTVAPHVLTKIRTLGMIIPIFFRGRRAELPPRIRDHMHFCDFSRYSLADPQILTNPSYDDDIRRIAEYIYEFYNHLDPWQQDLCGDCNSYEVPSEDEIKPLIQQSDQPTQRLPFR